MTAPSSEKAIAQELRLHVSPTPVVRLSRRALIALGAVSSLAIAGAIFWAMAEKPRLRTEDAAVQTDHLPPPDSLATLPADYASANATTPKLGPPLPGDLGRPMLAAGQAGASPMPSAGASPAASPTAAQQQLAQEQESARTSRIFASDSASHEQPPSLASDVAAVAGVSSPSPTRAPAPANATGQGEKTAFLAGQPDRRTTSDDRLQAAASPYVLQAGSVIPAALITGLRSDLPGEITAQVTEDVYDSPTGRYLLIPQGSRLIGEYDSQVSFGQSRVLLAWTRLILPNGRSMVLEKDSGADPAGYAGLEDRVDHHWGQLFQAALLSTILGVGAQAGASEGDSQVLQALREGAANSLNQVGQQVVGKSLDVQPTLNIRPGYPVRVMVTRDLVLQSFDD
jgi:type IV secretory pathway VirB10-like protein